MMATVGFQALLASLLIACATAAQRWPALPEGFSRSGGYVVVAGKGKPDPAATSETQRRALSRDAAILDARTRLSAYAGSLREGGKTLAEKAESDKAFRRKFQAALSLIQIAGTRWDEGGGAAATLKLNEAAFLEAVGLK